MRFCILFNKCLGLDFVVYTGLYYLDIIGSWFVLDLVGFYAGFTGIVTPTLASG